MDRPSRILLLILIIAVMTASGSAYEAEISDLTKHRDSPCNTVEWDEETDSFADLSGCSDTWNMYDGDLNDRQPTPVGYLDFAGAPECAEFDHRWQTLHEGEVVSESDWDTISGCAADDPTLDSFGGWYLWQGDGVNPDTEDEMGEYTMILHVRGADGFEDSVSWTYTFEEGDIDGDGYPDFEDGCPQTASPHDGIWGDGQYDNVYDEPAGCPDEGSSGGDALYVESTDYTGDGYTQQSKDVTFEIQIFNDFIECTIDHDDGTSGDIVLTREDLDAEAQEIGWTLHVSQTSHTYDEWGSYEPTLTCEDDDGNTKTTTRSLTLEEPAPECTPKSQACSDVSCGTVSNGCGGTYDCGSCDDDDPPDDGGDGDQPDDEPVDSDGDGVPDSEDACPNDPGADTDSDGDGYCDANEACPNNANRYPGNYNNAYCPDNYRWVCDGDTTRTQERQNRWSPRCGTGCQAGSWSHHTSEDPPGSQYECQDADGDGGSDAEWVDVVPPTTTDTSDDSWHRQPQTIQLVCDDTGGSGCDTTAYCIDQANDCTPDRDGTSVTVSTEGINYLRYRSTDNAGNREQVRSTEIKIDQTPPTITCEDCITPTTTAIGETVSIDPNATDQRSGLSSMTVCEDGSCSTIICSDPPCEYSKDEVYNTDIFARAIDSVGNVQRENIGQASFRRPIGALCDTDEQCISQRCVELQCAPENIAPGVDIMFDAMGGQNDQDTTGEDEDQ